jgi:hypothetical protein
LEKEIIMNKKWLSLTSCVCLLTLLGIVQADPLADWETAITAGNPLHWYNSMRRAKTVSIPQWCLTHV